MKSQNFFSIFEDSWRDRRPSIASLDDPVYNPNEQIMGLSDASCTEISPSTPPTEHPEEILQRASIKGRCSVSSESASSKPPTPKQSSRNIPSKLKSPQTSRSVSTSTSSPPSIERIINHEAKRKTEMCKYWISNKSCSYGSACMYAHGPSELKPKVRNSRFKTEICEDPAVTHLGACRYMRPSENRCNYVHPGEGLRLEMDGKYLESDYERILSHLGTQYPRGLYI